MYCKAFALSGRKLLWPFVPRALPWAGGFLPFQGAHRSLEPFFNFRNSNYTIVNDGCLCPLEAYASALAADVVGGLSPGLHEVGQVERFALYDEAALERVACLQACARGLLYPKLHVAEVSHTALAVGCPCEGETIVNGDVGGYVDMPANDRIAGIGASLGRCGAEVGIAAIAYETGQHVEGAAAGFALAVDVAPYTL